MGAEVACGHANPAVNPSPNGGASSSSGFPRQWCTEPTTVPPSTVTSSAQSANYSTVPGSGGGQRPYRVVKFQQLLSRASVDLSALRELLWSGAPDVEPSLRAEAWQMLLGYLPPVRERQSQGLSKKRAEYEELKRRHYRFDPVQMAVLDADGPTGSKALSVEAAAAAADADGDEGVAVLKQIRVDIPRTCQGGLPLFSSTRMHRLIERVLYIWSVRHPASGYVQGINDLATPFVVVLLMAELNSPIEKIDLDTVSDSVFDVVEAGTYWCLTKVLSDIQDHYTSGQPGIQSMVAKLKDIVRRIDEQLYRHLDEEGLDFLQFSFRWMNCLLMREFPLQCVIRLWDTYIAEPSEGFSTFHVYFCAVFLVYWKKQLMQMDFQQVMLFMQKLPTGKWRTREIETLISEAFVLKSLFHASPKHLVPTLQGI